MSGVRARFAKQLGSFSLAVEFQAPATGVTALFGVSGSGKTTVLRCVAGLERASDGELQVNGEWWQDERRGYFLPTHKRPLGYVFQEASLFAHRSVRGNLEYGMKRVPRQLRRVAFEQVVELLGVAQLLERSPSRLSGGERQRVAIARALLTSPQLLLMDEPLAALDAQSKAEILPYLERLHAELSIPVLYVSHAPSEVVRLADYMVLMEAGRVRAQGPLAELMVRLDLPLAQAEGAEAMVEATVIGHDDYFHLTELELGAARISVPREDLAPGYRARLRILARDVSLSLHRPKGTSILNSIPARIASLKQERPGQVMVLLEAEGTVFLARVTAKSVEQLGLAAGMPVFAQVKAVALVEGNS